MSRRRTLCALGLSALLAACGGGDDATTAPGGDPIIPSDPPPETAAFAAQGFWSGAVYPSAENAADRTDPLQQADVGVLPDGTAWGVYYTGGQESGLVVQGGFHGSFSLNGTALGGSVNEVLGFDWIPRTVQGPFETGASQMAYSLATDRHVASDRVTQPDGPSTLAQVAGLFRFSSFSKGLLYMDKFIQIQESGAFSYDEEGCVMTGSLSPRSDGSDQFNLAIAFSETVTGACIGLPAGTELAGHAYLHKSAEPQRLVGVALAADKSDGLFVAGQRIVAATPPPPPPAEPPPPPPPPAPPPEEL